MFLGVTGMLTCMSYTDEQRLAIAAVVKRTRVGKGLGKEAAAAAAELNSITWKRVEDAENVQDASLGKVLGSLGLPPADTILDGTGQVPPPVAYWTLSEDSGWYQQMLHSAKVLVEFAIDADAVDSQAAGVEQAADVETLKEQVTRLLVDIDRLTQRIQDEARDEIGDLSLLREIKSDVLRRRRLERLGRADASDDLLTEFFRFLQSEDARGLEDEELPRKFLESRRSLDEPELDGLDVIKGVVDGVALEEPDEGNHEGA